MKLDEEAGKICRWVATDESLVPVGLGLVCAEERRKKKKENKGKRRTGSQKQGGKNRENGGMHATKMAAHCVHSIGKERERERCGGHETGMEAVVEWG